ncbi:MULTISPECIES: MarR family winged helix-turn-helix transcriptional regulator [Williamsia]|uniref:MarR family transcriptional regulator n=1 Tax=Williamsia marianensis TaxID=85044 RepID=A0A495ISM1_WILMA|nr:MULTISPECIES: MarR family transcriptional regulator [Williamsia]ETD32812.1 MarR family transcriptional regulator [Williamsia sp. D3]PZT95347.1 MAG: MarR family transcriptional regulator [Gordonia sp. (in: high G+C Gram-positive bacteria)]RKR79785.1 MarR family transcriptional regulator [Williamsia muralis]
MSGKKTTGGPATAAPTVNEISDAVLTASRLLVSIAARSIAEVEQQVTLPQFRVLVVLENRGTVTLNSLAQALSVEKSTMGRMVDRLVTSGLVSRTESPTSRRERNIALTDHGQKLVKTVSRRRHKEIERVVAQMAPDQRVGLVAALTAFTDAGGEPAIDQSYWV